MMSHSQGTIIVFAYLATKPEHSQEKVDMTIFCLTAVFMGGFFKKVLGKWVYNIGIYTVGRILNYLLMKYLFTN